MVKPWRLLRRQPNEKKRPKSTKLEDPAAEKDAIGMIKTTIYHVPSLPSPPKEPPPRLELPMDFRTSAFSRATYSPPCSPPYPNGHKLRRIPAMDDLSGGGFRFLDLPAELRLNILSQYFGKRTMAIDLRAPARSQKRFFSLAHKERKQNVIALLQSCRQLSKEAYEVLLNNTTFIIRVGNQFSVEKQPKPAIPLQRVRHVILNVGYVSKESMTGLYELLFSFNELKTTDVHFDFTEPDFASSGSDDWMVEAFFDALETEKLRRVSCVSHLRPGAASVQYYRGREMRKLIPYSCPAFQDLKQKYHA